MPRVQYVCLFHWYIIWSAHIQSMSRNILTLLPLGSDRVISAYTERLIKPMAYHSGGTE